ncbi:MAG: nucleoside deaminase [Eubacterium sp.]|nr:nucleoside deaminase [Eubacterium sp.]
MNKYMKEADKLARDNLKTNAGGPFGAVVVKDGEIVGRGSNHVLAYTDPTAHAEVTAIRDACKNLGTHDLSGCEIYTTCYPCPMCISAIIWANIKKVYYGNTKDDAAKIGFRDAFIYDYLEKLNKNVKDNETLELLKLDRDETIECFNMFNEKSDKTIY